MLSRQPRVVCFGLPEHRSEGKLKGWASCLDLRSRYSPPTAAPCCSASFRGWLPPTAPACARAVQRSRCKPLPPPPHLHPPLGYPRPPETTACPPFGNLPTAPPQAPEPCRLLCQPRAAGWLCPRCLSRRCRAAPQGSSLARACQMGCGDRAPRSPSAARPEPSGRFGSGQSSAAQRCRSSVARWAGSRRPAHTRLPPPR
mmetsp:Transcript_25879/g.72482  ORF Transcript_25879/g.72482 Transcript_25879/m.72482 type:complete len:200 (-) Transcript_25879:66-665(-)